MPSTWIGRALGLGMTCVLLTTCGHEDQTAPSETESPPSLQSAPAAGASAVAPEVLVGAGDIGTCSGNNDEKTAQLLDQIAGTVFTLGDNVYNSGSASEYQNCYDPTWGRHKARTYPSIGDKEYAGGNATPTFDYFGSRVGPRDKGYYSYDLGAWHIIVLNSNKSYVPVAAGSVQEQWLRADLEANTKKCILAYWHRPLFFSYNSGDGEDSWLRPFWNALYEYGADVVLNGQRHNYERFAHQNPDGDLDPERGIRQFIVGTGGKSKGGNKVVREHSEVRIYEYGVLKLTLSDGSYTWEFIPVANGAPTDSGTESCHGGGGGDPGPGGISPTLSEIAVSPSSITAGTESGTVTVTARDGAGDPVAGATVVLDASGQGTSLEQPTAPTNASGVATGGVTSTVAGTKTISATIDGVAITEDADVTVTAGSPSATRSSLAATPATIAPGTGLATITATVLDQHDNPVPGATVVLDATGGGNTLTQPGAATDAQGRATGSLSSTVEGSKTITATADGQAITDDAVVTVEAGTPSTIAHTLLTSGNHTTNQKVYTTEAIAPAPNTLVTVSVLGHRTPLATTVSLSGGGMDDWTEIASVEFDPLGSARKRITVFRAMSANPGSGPITIRFAKNVSNAHWVVSQWSGVETSGSNGAGAIGQTASDESDAVDGFALTLPQLGGSSAALGVFAVNSSTPEIAPGAGFAEIAEHASGESPGADLQTEWAVGRDEILASWSSHRAGALAIELKAAGAP